ncbi:MAG: hypothetical protein IPK19_33525 [Chloroflexi bacterium]|nr:hypothetical protein [Chloroflexota bacterium]
MNVAWHRYSLYGLRIRSTAPIHGLREFADDAAADLTIFDDEMPPGLDSESPRWVPAESLTLAADAPSVMDKQTVRQSDDGQFLQWRYGDHMTLAFSIDGSKFYTRWGTHVDPAVRAFNIFGPGLGLVLRLRGVPALHASVVDISGKGIAITGASGAGKSTLAAAFEQSGAEVRSDDLCALYVVGERLLIPQGPPRVRLLPDAAHALFGETGTFSPAPDHEKLEHPLHWLTVGTIEEVVPLEAVYILAGREEVWRISQFGGSSALFTLMRSVYLRFLTNASMRQRDFEVIDALLQRIPVFLMVTPNGHHQLTKLCREIISRHSS